jgi:D-alanyl-D-alanine carboxypeptidase
MNKFKFFKENKVRVYEMLLILIAALCIYFYKNNLDYRAQNLSVINESNLLKKNLDEINQKYVDIVNKIEVTEQDKIYLYNSLNGVLSDYSGLMKNYDTKLKEVGTLSKAVYYDDELLKKYSKYYFLNENYTPSSTILINTEYTLNNKEVNILTEVKPKLESMISDASSSDIKIIVHSGYRSFAEQKGLKSAYTRTYGITKSNQFSADQGYSEHQLGTTVDITDGKSGLSISFDKTKTYGWLQNNAYKHGFILSYNKNNVYYQYEPWHWRYIGVELATYMHDNNLNFYDIDQNKIDEYKTKIFD